MESVEALVQEVKEEIFSSFDPYSFVLPSAYDTAWLAMIPHPNDPNRPMFEKCVDWILQNQREEGFWGGEPGHDSCNNNAPSIECLPATLACLVALKRWEVGSTGMEAGLAFIQENTEKLLREEDGCYPRWFVILFPAMLDLAQSAAIDVSPAASGEALDNILCERKRILERERYGGGAYDPPLLSYVEALPSTYVSCYQITQHQSEDGSLFQSPSATAYAFMATGNQECRIYLESILQRCKNGVPPVYPVDEELVKLCLVNKLERLGLAEHFPEEIEQMVLGIYRNWRNQESEDIRKPIDPQQIFKDSLSFQLLRMNGYSVVPREFCWYLQHHDMAKYIEENYQYFLSAMLNVHRATDLMFPGEKELKDVRTFSRRLLEKGKDMISTKNNALISSIKKEIEHELRLPWLARLDHLEHRVAIEGAQTDHLWAGKVSFYRLSYLNNTTLLQLAKENYELRQSVFINELEEMKRWSEKSGLRDIGFGREKTTYCYFAIAASAYQPSLSDLRIVVAKIAILVTVIDDFFDMEASINELNELTVAIQRWDGDGLCDHNKVIFDALDNLTSDIAVKLLDQQRNEVVDNFRNMWYGTILSWLKEAEWSKKQVVPSIEEYIETGMTSIAAHMLILPAIYLTGEGLSEFLLRDIRSEIITKLLMLITRLLNDIWSYQKELKDNKPNLVFLYMKENPEASIEDSITFIEKVLDEKKKEMLELVLEDDPSDMPKSLKQCHLSCLKVFQMFYNSSNGYDSATEMLDNVKKAINDPVTLPVQLPLRQDIIPPSYGSIKINARIKRQIAKSFQDHGSSVVALTKSEHLNHKEMYKISQYKTPHHIGSALLGRRGSFHYPLIPIKFITRSCNWVSMPCNIAKPFF